MQQLTAEQRETIKNSLWVVNTVLKEQGLQDDQDMRSQAVLYLCKCLLRYDQNRGVKWTTYAYKSVYLFVTRRHASEKTNEARFVGEDQMADIPDETADTETQTHNRLLIARIRKLLDEKEQQVFDLKLQDYSTTQIAEQLDCSRESVRLRWLSIQQKAKSLL